METKTHEVLIYAHVSPSDLVRSSVRTNSLTLDTKIFKYVPLKPYDAVCKTGAKHDTTT